MNQSPPNKDDQPHSPAQTNQQNAASPDTQLYGKQEHSVQPKRHADKWNLPLKIILFPIFLLILLWDLVENGFERLLDGTFIGRNRNGFFGTLQLIFGAILLAVIINGFVFQSYQVVGQSMSTTLENGDRLLINKLGKTWSTITRSEYVPKRGDIIVFKSPIDGERQLVKRVIGVPGDRVIYSNGVFTIVNDANPDGFNPDDMVSADIIADDTYSISQTVNEGELFVAGDNRLGGASLDSRNDLGLVQTDSVVGDLIIRILPLSESRVF